MGTDSTQELIFKVRTLINDKGSEEAFSNEEIQSFLKQSRTYQQEYPLMVLRRVGMPDTMFQANVPYWDEDVVLTNWDSQTIEAKTKDTLSGYFEFEEGQKEVFATGFTYDVYFASAELLTVWAGRLEGEIESFSSDGSSYKFASGIQSKLKLAEEYKRKSYQFGAIKTAKMVRNDTTY